MEQHITTTPESTVLEIKAWPDPVIDKLGFDPASAYVELTGAVGIFKPRQCCSPTGPEAVK